MDFKEIKNININTNNTEKNRPKSKKAINSSAKKENLKETPSNPSFWQNTVGVKKHNVSFGNNSSIEETFIEEQLRKIKSSYHFRESDNALLPKYKTAMQKLSVHGENAVVSYANIIFHSLRDVWMEEEKKRWAQSAEEIITILPNMDEEALNLSMRLIRNISASKRTEKDFEEYLNITKEILKKENADNITKIKWLTNLTKISYGEKEKEAPPFEEINNKFETYIKLKDLLFSEKDQISLMNTSLTTQQQKGLIKLFEDESIPNNNLNFFVSGNIDSEIPWMDDSAKTLGEIVEIILDKKDKKELFVKLIDYKNIGTKIPTKIMLDLLNEDTDFVNSALDFLTNKKIEKNEPYITTDSSCLAGFFKAVNQSNFEDFKILTDEFPIVSSLYTAQKYLNPKTGLYDKSIAEHIKEFDELGISSWKTESAVLACYDLKTGEFSPIAQEILELVFPEKFKNKGKESKFDTIKKSIQLFGKPKFLKSLYNDEIVDLISSLKNNDGEFTKNNLNHFYSLLRANRKINKYRYVEVSALAKIMNSIKDNKGNVDNEKLELAVKIIRTLKNYDIVGTVLSSLAMFPDDKQKRIYETCTSLAKNEKINLQNLAVFAEFCHDENGNLDKDKLNLVKSLVETNDIAYDKNFLNLFEKYPKLKPFFFEVVKNVRFTSNVSWDLEKIIEQYKNENISLPEDIQNRVLNYLKICNQLHNFVDLNNACTKISEDGKSTYFDEKTFQKATNLIDLEKRLCHSSIISKGKNSVDIINQELSIKNIKFSERVELLNSLREIRNYLQEITPSEISHINKAISDIESSLSVENIGMPVSKEDNYNFIKNIIKSNKANEELTPFEKVMSSSIAELKTFKNGLPLRYSRKSFLEDLSKICDTEEKIKLLEKKTGINVEVIEEDEAKKINAYNGLIRLDELDKNDETEKEIYDCAYNFLYNNKINTGNSKLDEQLNYIIKACPEFINIIGKKQHGTHAYTVDVHSILVLANSINNPNYNEKLNSLDKSLLKISTIFHDLMKKEGVVDKGHQNLSSLYTRSIIKKFINNPEIQDRVFEIVDNHHWTEEYATCANKEEKAKELSFRFRRPNDFEIAQIMARSDLMSVNDDFYERIKPCLDEENIAPIKNNLEHIYATGNAFFSDKIIAQSKLEKNIQTKNGKKYAVINLHNINDDDDMGEYGFQPNRKKKDLKFLVHMVDDHSIYNSLSTLKLLSSPFNGGVLSESIITPQYKRTYCNRKYGVLLSQINTNIVNQNKSNQGSGREKDISNIISLIFNGVSSIYRENYRNELLENLGINPKDVTNAEYAQFYKETLASKNSILEIPDKETYTIGNFTFSGEELKKAINKYQDDLIDKEEKNHNEIVGYTPKIQAVIAKENSLDNVPDELLNFAEENNLPIILI